MSFSLALDGTAAAWSGSVHRGHSSTRTASMVCNVSLHSSVCRFSKLGF